MSREIFDKIDKLINSYMPMTSQKTNSGISPTVLTNGTTTGMTANTNYDNSASITGVKTEPQETVLTNEGMQYVYGPAPKQPEDASITGVKTEPQEIVLTNEGMQYVYGPAPKQPEDASITGVKTEPQEIILEKRPSQLVYGPSPRPITTTKITPSQNTTVTTRIISRKTEDDTITGVKTEPQEIILEKRPSQLVYGPSPRPITTTKITPSQNTTITTRTIITTTPTTRMVPTPTPRMEPATPTKRMVPTPRIVTTRQISYASGSRIPNNIPIVSYSSGINVGY